MLDVLVDGSRKAVRLLLDGKSGGPGPAPAWVGAAADFEFVGSNEGSTVLTFEARTLQEVVPNRVAQGEMFDAVPGDASGLGLFRISVADALTGQAESNTFDSGVLATIEDWQNVFSYGVREVEFGNASGPVIKISPAGIETARRLRRETPAPQRVRVTGWLDAIRHHDRMFTLKLEDGATLRSIAESVDTHVLASLFGKKATISALAVFRPSGRVLRLEADHIEPAGEDFSFWSTEPEPIDQTLDDAALRKPQGPRSGINAIIGRWPGDETDDEILRALEDLS